MSDRPVDSHAPDEGPAADSPDRSGPFDTSRDNAGPAGDGGVISRLRARTGAAAVVVALVTVVLAALGWWRPGWFVGSAGAVIGAIAVGLLGWGAAVLARRSVGWARAGRLLLGESGPDGRTSTALGGDWLPAVCGAAVPLHRTRRNVGGIRVGRRLTSHILPLRAVSGPLAAGRPVLLHARPDGALPSPGERMELLALARRGPYLLRDTDRTVFAADAWLWSVL